MKTGKIGSEGVKQLIKDGVLKKDDFFVMPGFIKAGRDLWSNAVDIVWKSGKILDIKGKPNYGFVTNVWKNLYKKKFGDYPQAEKEGGLKAYFDKQGKKMTDLLMKMLDASSKGVKIGGRGRQERAKAVDYLRGLVSDIEIVIDQVIEDENAVSKIDDILERLNEDNPWHNGGGRFAKGGHKTADMWSLYGERKSVKRGKAGIIKFRKLSEKRAAKINEWRKSLGPHPEVKGSSKPPYRGVK